MALTLEEKRKFEEQYAKERQGVLKHDMGGYADVLAEASVDSEKPSSYAMLYQRALDNPSEVGMTRAQVERDRGGAIAQIAKKDWLDFAKDTFNDMLDKTDNPDTAAKVADEVLRYYFGRPAQMQDPQKQKEFALSEIANLQRYNDAGVAYANFNNARMYLSQEKQLPSDLMPFGDSEEMWNRKTKTTQDADISGAEKILASFTGNTMLGSIAQSLGAGDELQRKYTTYLESGNSDTLGTVLGVAGNVLETIAATKIGASVYAKGNLGKMAMVNFVVPFAKTIATGATTDYAESTLGINQQYFQPLARTDKTFFGQYIASRLFDAGTFAIGSVVGSKLIESNLMGAGFNNWLKTESVKKLLTAQIAYPILDTASDVAIDLTAHHLLSSFAGEGKTIFTASQMRMFAMPDEKSDTYKTDVLNKLINLIGIRLGARMASGAMNKLISGTKAGKAGVEEIGTVDWYKKIAKQDPQGGIFNGLKLKGAQLSTFFFGNSLNDMKAMYDQNTTGKDFITYLKDEMAQPSNGVNSKNMVKYYWAMEAQKNALLKAAASLIDGNSVVRPSSYENRSKMFFGSVDELHNLAFKNALVLNDENDTRAVAAELANRINNYSTVDEVSAELDNLRATHTLTQRAATDLVAKIVMEMQKLDDPDPTNGMRKNKIKTITSHFETIQSAPSIARVQAVGDDTKKRYISNLHSAVESRFSPTGIKQSDNSIIGTAPRYLDNMAEVHTVIRSYIDQYNQDTGGIFDIIMQNRTKDWDRLFTDMDTFVRNNDPFGKGKTADTETMHIAFKKSLEGFTEVRAKELIQLLVGINQQVDKIAPDKLALMIDRLTNELTMISGVFSNKGVRDVILDAQKQFETMSTNAKSALNSYVNNNQVLKNIIQASRGGETGGDFTYPHLLASLLADVDNRNYNAFIVNVAMKDIPLSAKIETLQDLLGNGRVTSTIARNYLRTQVGLNAPISENGDVNSNCVIERDGISRVIGGENSTASLMSNISLDAKVEITDDIAEGLLHSVVLAMWKDTALGNTEFSDWARKNLGGVTFTSNTNDSVRATVSDMATLRSNMATLRDELLLRISAVSNNSDYSIVDVDDVIIKDAYQVTTHKTGVDLTFLDAINSLIEDGAKIGVHFNGMVNGIMHTAGSRAEAITRIKELIDVVTKHSSTKFSDTSTTDMAEDIFKRQAMFRGTSHKYDLLSGIVTTGGDYAGRITDVGKRHGIAFYSVTPPEDTKASTESLRAHDELMYKRHNLVKLPDTGVNATALYIRVPNPTDTEGLRFFSKNMVSLIKEFVSRDFDTLDDVTGVTNVKQELVDLLNKVDFESLSAGTFDTVLKKVLTDVAKVKKTHVDNLVTEFSKFNSKAMELNKENIGKVDLTTAAPDLNRAVTEMQRAMKLVGSVVGLPEAGSALEVEVATFFSRLYNGGDTKEAVDAAKDALKNSSAYTALNPESQAKVDEYVDVWGENPDGSIATDTTRLDEKSLTGLLADFLSSKAKYTDRALAYDEAKKAGTEMFVEQDAMRAFREMTATTGIVRDKWRDRLADRLNTLRNITSQQERNRLNQLISAAWIHEKTPEGTTAKTYSRGEAMSRDRLLNDYIRILNKQSKVLDAFLGDKDSDYSFIKPISEMDTINLFTALGASAEFGTKYLASAPDITKRGAGTRVADHPVFSKLAESILKGSEEIILFTESELKIAKTNTMDGQITIDPRTYSEVMKGLTKPTLALDSGLTKIQLVPEKPTSNDLQALIQAFNNRQSTGGSFTLIAKNGELYKVDRSGKETRVRYMVMDAGSEKIISQNMMHNKLRLIQNANPATAGITNNDHIDYLHFNDERSDGQVYLRDVEVVTDRDYIANYLKAFKLHKDTYSPGKDVTVGDQGSDHSLQMRAANNEMLIKQAMKSWKQIEAAFSNEDKFSSEAALKAWGQKFSNAMSDPDRSPGIIKVIATDRIDKSDITLVMGSDGEYFQGDNPALISMNIRGQLYESGNKPIDGTNYLTTAKFGTGATLHHARIHLLEDIRSDKTSISIMNQNGAKSAASIADIKKQIRTLQKYETHFDTSDDTAMKEIADATRFLMSYIASEDHKDAHIRLMQTGTIPDPANPKGEPKPIYNFFTGLARSPNILLGQGHDLPAMITGISVCDDTIRLNFNIKGIELADNDGDTIMTQPINYLDTIVKRMVGDDNRPLSRVQALQAYGSEAIAENETLRNLQPPGRDDDVNRYPIANRASGQLINAQKESNKLSTQYAIWRRQSGQQSISNKYMEELGINNFFKPLPNSSPNVRLLNKYVVFDASKVTSKKSGGFLEAGDFKGSFDTFKTRKKYSIGGKTYNLHEAVSGNKMYWLLSTSDYPEFGGISFKIEAMLDISNFNKADLDALDTALVGTKMFDAIPRFTKYDTGNLRVSSSQLVNKAINSMSIDSQKHKYMYGFVKLIEKHPDIMNNLYKYLYASQEFKFNMTPDGRIYGSNIDTSSRDVAQVGEVETDYSQQKRDERIKFVNHVESNMYMAEILNRVAEDIKTKTFMDDKAYKTIVELGSKKIINSFDDLDDALRLLDENAAIAQLASLVTIDDLGGFFKDMMMEAHPSFIKGLIKLAHAQHLSKKLDGRTLEAFFNIAEGQGDRFLNLATGIPGGDKTKYDEAGKAISKRHSLVGLLAASQSLDMIRNSFTDNLHRSDALNYQKFINASGRNLTISGMKQSEFARNMLKKIIIFDRDTSISTTTINKILNDLGIKIEDGQIVDDKDLAILRRQNLKYYEGTSAGVDEEARSKQLARDFGTARDGSKANGIVFKDLQGNVLSVESVFNKFNNRIIELNNSMKSTEDSGKVGYTTKLRNTAGLFEALIGETDVLSRATMHIMAQGWNKTLIKNVKTSGGITPEILDQFNKNRSKALLKNFTNVEPVSKRELNLC